LGQTSATVGKPMFAHGLGLPDEEPDVVPDDEEPDVAPDEEPDGPTPEEVPDAEPPEVALPLEAPELPVEPEVDDPLEPGGTGTTAPEHPNESSPPANPAKTRANEVERTEAVESRRS
jgi:hypothetical protein